MLAATVVAMSETPHGKPFFDPNIHPLGHVPEMRNGLLKGAPFEVEFVEPDLLPAQASEPLSASTCSYIVPGLSGKRFAALFDGRREFAAMIRLSQSASRHWANGRNGPSENCSISCESYRG